MNPEQLANQAQRIAHDFVFGCCTNEEVHARHVAHVASLSKRIQDLANAWAAEFCVVIVDYANQIVELRGALEEARGLLPAFPNDSDERDLCAKITRLLSRAAPAASPKDPRV
jgi:hypothetical protein